MSLPPLQKTKSTPPRITNTLLRERLFRDLDIARGHPIVWVSAPAGAGKTLLVSSYIENRKAQCIWYQLDPSDDDPASFFHNFTTAVKRITENPDFPSFAPEHYASLPVFSRHFFGVLQEKIPRRCLLVFDDHHDLSADSPVHNVFRHGLAVFSGPFNSILMSRSSPPPSMVRMLSTEQMTRFPGESLRLTLEESRLIAKARGLDPTVEEERIQAIHAATEGWAAGFSLSLLHAKDTRRSADLPKNTLFDYFAGEILADRDSSVQDFLLKTAFFPEFTAEMAGRLTGNSFAQDLLSELTRNNFFITLRDEKERLTYRYHALFREFLLEKARIALQGNSLESLRLSAARILLEEDRPEEAFHLLADAARWEESADLVKSRGAQLLGEGRHVTLMEWLARFPTEAIEKDPWLAYLAGAARLPLQGPLEVRRYFEKAFRDFRDKGEIAGQYLAWCGVAETFFFGWHDFNPMDDWLDILDQLRRKYPEYPDPEIKARVVVSAFGGLCFRRPWKEAIRPWAEEAERLYRNTTSPALRMNLVMQIMLRSAWQGDCRKIETFLEETDFGSTPSNISPLEEIGCQTIKAYGSWMTGRAGQALEILEMMLERAERERLFSLLTTILAEAAFVCMSEGKIRQALEYLERMRPLVQPERMLDFSKYHFLRSMACLHRRSPADAMRHLKVSLKYALDSGAPYPIAINRIAMAHLLVLSAEGNAEEELEEAGEIALRTGSSLLRAGCAMISAQDFFRRGENTAGVTRLRETFSIMKENRIVFFDWWYGPTMAELCARAMEANIETDFVRGLIQKCHLAPEKPPIEIEEWPWPVRIYTLGRFKVIKEDEPLRFERKSQKRPIQFLQALVALGGREVSQLQIEDALWPNASGDAARRAFGTTLYRLRKLIGSNVLHLEEGKVTLDARTCWVDIWALERMLRRIEDVLREDSATSSELLRLTDKILALLQGPFLGREAEEPWAMAQREKVRHKVRRVFKDLGGHFGHHGACEKALAIYRKALEIDPLAEEFYRRLMGCYAALERTPEAMAAYQHCRKILTATLKTPPSPRTEELLRTVRHNDRAILSALCAACRRRY